MRENTLALAQREPVPEAPLYNGVIADELESGWLISGGLVATRALSCLLEPRPGDRVLYAACDEAVFVLAVLSGERVEPGVLSLPGRAPLSLKSRALQLLGEQSLQLLCRGELALRTLRSLEFTARHCFTSVTESLVQVAREHISRARQVSVQADELLRTHAHHQVITAREDIKVDAERISMG